MTSLSTIRDIEQNARRGLRVSIDHVFFRDYKWQPHLDVQIAIESVRQIPLRITAVDLQLYYNAQEVGPLPALPRPYELNEPGEGVEIRMRKDLYPTLAEELAKTGGKEGYYEIRGIIIVESPGYSGFIEFPVDLSYSAK